jgi:hypothetical protein
MRELTHPIACRTPSSLVGPAYYGGSTPKSDYGAVDTILKGYADDGVYYDATGGMFEVERIYLSDAPWWRPLLRRAANLFVFKPKRKYPHACVDVRLRLVRRFTLEEFCDHIREFALSHPDWWVPEASEDDYRTMFDGCSNIAEAIGRIISLEAPKLPRPPKGGAKKVVDLRTRKDPTWF